MTGVMPVGDGTHACFLILVIECTLGEKMLSVEWIKKVRFIGSCRDFANEGLANPVYVGKTLVFTPHMTAGFGNPAEHHGNSQRAKSNYSGQDPKGFFC
jgi:hypothetical protein